MNRVLFLVALTGSILFAESSVACETCKKINNTVSCWSGALTGYQSCYGGFGEPCHLDGPGCIEAEQLKSEPTPLEVVCANPVGGCAERDRERMPIGFVLDAQDLAHASRVRRASPTRS